MYVLILHEYDKGTRVVPVFYLNFNVNRINFMVTLKLMSKQDWHLWMRRRSLYTLFLHIVRTNARKGFWLIRSNKITILSLSVMSCRRTWAVIKPFHFKNIPFPVFWLKSLKNKFWKLIHEMGDKRFLEGALLQDNTSRDGP